MLGRGSVVKSAKWLLIVVVLLLLTVLQTQADVVDAQPLYLYYFETDDVLLASGESQAYQFATFAEDGTVRIVVYGLDRLVRPEVTLYNSEGDLVATGRSNPYFFITVTATPSDVPVESTAEATPQPTTEPVATEATPDPVATEASPKATPVPETTAES
ncbi:MAG: hypothetical protein Q9P44_21120 [Anaerolineae bacterium]|nr:hypothetical protein [Anaerolineae bacterium]